VEREESMNRDREPAQERRRKAKDSMGNRAEREELKNSGWIERWRKKFSKAPDSRQTGAGSTGLPPLLGPFCTCFLKT